MNPTEIKATFQDTGGWPVTMTWNAETPDVVAVQEHSLMLVQVIVVVAVDDLQGFIEMVREYQP